MRISDRFLKEIGGVEAVLPELATELHAVLGLRRFPGYQHARIEAGKCLVKQRAVTGLTAKFWVDTLEKRGLVEFEQYQNHYQVHVPAPFYRSHSQG